MANMIGTSRSVLARSAMTLFGLWLVAPCAFPAAYQGAGTRRMAERLDRIAREADPLRNPFLNRRAAEIFEAQLAELVRGPGAANPTAVVSARFKHGYELLNSGNTEQALTQFRTLLDEVDRHQITLAPDKLALVRDCLIVGWLRLGEQENCQLHHNAQSCLFPIAGSGVHIMRHGSRMAVGLLTEQLARERGLKYGWLLNLAYMTLGEWPDKVPPQFLIPPRVFAAEHDVGRFPDVAGNLGLDVNDLAGSVVMDDFDNDADLDLMICAWGLRDQLRLFINHADGTFTDGTEAAGLTGEIGGLNMVQADYNNDGFVDVFVLRGAWFEAEGHHPDSLLRNNGNGTFDDVTEEAGLLSFHPSQTAAWLDFNNDGWIDLFIGNETTPGDTNRCQLFRNNSDGTFTEMAQAAGLTALGLIKAVHAGDYNNDGRPDLYVSCRGQFNFLYRNDGPQGTDPSPRGAWRFTDVTREAGVAEPRYSFPAWFFDYDQDGWLDLYVSGYRARDVGGIAADYLGVTHASERQRLYRNKRDGTFEDVTRASGLWKTTMPMAGNFGDLENDGWLDFYLGTGTPDLSMLIPNRMFRNDGGKSFQEVTTSGGFGHLQKGHGIAFGDLDHDGDQDIYESIGGAYEGDAYRNVLFENPGHDHAWLKLKLVGTRSNRAAIGARVKITVESAEGLRTIHKEVNSGGTFGASPLRQEFGLGQARALREVEVWWPASELRQRVEGLKLNQAYLVREGQPQAQPLALTSFRFKKAGGHQHTGPVEDGLPDRNASRPSGAHSPAQP